MTAEWLGDAANEGHISEAGHFWRGEAATLLAPLLYAAGLIGADMPQVLHWLHDRSVEDVLDILGSDHAEGAAARRAIRGQARRRRPQPRHHLHERHRAARGLPLPPPAGLHPARRPHRRRPSSTASANTVYVIAPEHQQELLRPIIVALVSQLYVAAVEKANAGNAPGGELPLGPAAALPPRRGRQHRPAAAACPTTWPKASASGSPS